MSYISDDFLIPNKFGQKLYESYAKNMPIFDFHCHLDPKEIYENHKYANLTEIWLGGDHYKWRAMRINGVEERYITGDASDYEKFLAFVDTLQYAVANPLYQWAHLELKRYFNIDCLLTSETAPMVWEVANKALENFGSRDFIRKANVTHIGTTDDPTSDLRYHNLLKDDKSFGVKVFPCFRADLSFKPEAKNYLNWLSKLEGVTGLKIDNINTYMSALEQRIIYFSKHGSNLADHGFEEFTYSPCDSEKAQNIFAKCIRGEQLSREELICFKSFINCELAKLYTKYNWTMQMHVGALRNNNSVMYKRLGPDSGFDSMGDFACAVNLNRFMDELNSQDCLPKTIVYNLNSNNNDVMASIMGNFPKEGVPVRVITGAAWWFYDQKDGIVQQIKSMANLGLLGRFVGMVTDSRSFMSYTRHEYFRRVLCNWLGILVETKEIPNDEQLLAKMIKNVCYNNAKAYFCGEENECN